MQYIDNNGDRIIEHFTNKKSRQGISPNRKRNVLSAHYKCQKKKKNDFVKVIPLKQK